jgi:branched-chain amino acid transport system substrate-binding protein
VDRRTLLKLSGAGLLGATAGCLEGSDGANTGGEPTDSGGSGGTEEEDVGGGSGGSGPVTVGMVDSLTGTLAPYGQRNKRGKELALADINAVGIGSEGRPFEVLVEDDESTTRGGVNAARKLVNQNRVPHLIGTVGSGVTLAIYQSVVKGAGIPQISQNSTSPKLTEYPELLRTSPSGAAKGKALAKLVAEDHDAVAVTWINNDYGSGLASVFEESFEGTVTYNSPHDQGATSYSGILSEMAATDATAWMFFTYAAEYTKMVNEAYDKGYNEQVQYYGAESTIADSIIENTPEGSMSDMVGITESAPKDQESYQKFKSEFEAAYDASPTVWAAYAYDAVTISAIAAEAAPEITGPAMKDVIKDVTRPEGTAVYSFAEAKEALANGGTAADINYEGVSGPVDLDENGDPPGYYQIYKIENHEYVFGDYITS